MRPSNAQRSLHSSTQHIGPLQIVNPDDMNLLTLEPFHPYTSDRLARQYNNLGFLPKLARQFAGAGLSVISVPLLKDYHNAAFFEFLSREGISRDAYLLDPLYGLIIWKEGRTRTNNRRFRNHCLALQASFRQQLCQKGKIRECLTKPEMMLSQGVILLEHVAASALDSSSRARMKMEIPEVLVESEVHFLQITERIRSACEGSGVQLWYRGQPIPDSGSCGFVEGVRHAVQ